jgi:hypothetical protein
MAKVSFATKDQSASGLGFQEGWGEIVEIGSTVHQFEPNKDTGVQGDPAPMIRLMIQRTDAEGNATDEDPIEQFLGCGKLEKFHPGNMTSRDDEDPEDAGEELDVTGNSLYSVDGARLNTQSRWAMFCQSLESKGVKPEILSNGYLPDLIGMKALFETVKLPKRPGDKAEAREQSSFRVAKITVYPGTVTGKGKAAAGKGKAAAASAGKAATSTSASAASKKEPAGAEVDDDIATKAITVLERFKASKAGQTLTLAKVKANSITVFAKEKFPSNTHKAIMTLLTDATWLDANCGDLGVGFDAESNGGELTFPEAE